MPERDEKGRFKKKNNESPQPQYLAREGVEMSSTAIVMILLGIFLLGIIGGVLIGIEISKQPLSGNTTAQQYQQVKILNAEKELISKIIDYEAQYGSRSVSWNVGVNF